MGENESGFYFPETLLTLLPPFFELIYSSILSFFSPFFSHLDTE